MEDRSVSIELNQGQCLDLLYLMRAGLRSFQETVDNDPDYEGPGSVGNWAIRGAVESMERTVSSVKESIALQNGGYPNREGGTQ